jgi:hypothetical protein
MRALLRLLAALGWIAGIGSLWSACGGSIGPSTSSGAPASDAAASPRAVPTKVDILVDVDNSASMGGKQAYLMQAVPDLVGRLINPDCIDPGSGLVVAPSSEGRCVVGVLEFPPVHDLHLGMVTSSLGSRLSGAAPREENAILCDPNASAPAPFQSLPAHADDQAHLVARSLIDGGDGHETEGAVGDAVVAGYTPAPGGFLDWVPQAAGGASPSAGIDATSLVADMQTIIGGAGTFGCGIESPLESWYRFLVQPDPYAGLVLSDRRATWVGVDAELLKQRHDFLRPDSLLVVIVVSDENDSEVDVRSLGGMAYLLMGSGFQVPRGTSPCATDPQDPACVSCGTAQAGDPACALGPYHLQNDWGFDPNLRHVHMKEKYGVDAQYPIQRYLFGLTSNLIPDRSGEYPAGATNYRGFPDCVNPIFAASLPDGSDVSPRTLCGLPLGTRTPDDVTFAVIAGVPPSLLHYDPASRQASALTDGDWVRILGKGQASMTAQSPMSYDYTGIDPHMIEDYRDRTTVAYPFPTDPSGTNPLAAATKSVGADPTNGREWITDQPFPGPHVLAVDREYACTYPLAEPRDCTLPENAPQCDCPSTTGLSPQQTPPVCDPQLPTSQIAEKAYPTIRELLLARLLGSQAVVGSLCPAHPFDGGGDPLFGYRPLMTQIGDRLARSLGRKDR